MREPRVAKEIGMLELVRHLMEHHVPVIGQQAESALVAIVKAIDAVPAAVRSADLEAYRHNLLTILEIAAQQEDAVIRAFERMREEGNPGAVQ